MGFCIKIFPTFV